MNLLFFSANLIFIVTNLYGWILKKFFIPYGCEENFKELYPAQKIIAALYFTQIFEVLYLFRLGDPATLFYVNATGVLVFSAFMLLMVWGYFFLRSYSVKELVIHFAPVVLTALVLLLPVTGLIPFTSHFKMIMSAVVLLLCAGYVYRLFAFRRYLYHKVEELNEDEYSNYMDFPLSYAIKIEWVPLGITAITFICFVADNEFVKMFRDIFNVIVNVWFAITTLNPHRAPQFSQAAQLKEIEASKNLPESENGSEQVRYRLTEEQFRQLRDRLFKYLEQDRLYLQEHVTLGDLAKLMNTNKNYLSETISRTSYSSFYNLINTYRIEHACKIIEHDCNEKLEQIAFASGFTSGSSFSQIFKKIKNIPPNEYVKQVRSRISG